MDKIIKLGKREATSLYGGRFLITTYDEGVYSIRDIEKERDIPLPALDNNFKWQVEKVTNNAIVFCRVSQTISEYVKCVFLKDTNNFLKHPDSSFIVFLCNSVEITDKTIYCTVTKKQYYFNAFGEMLASIEVNEDNLYTVKLRDTEIVENVSEVQPIGDIQSQEIVGLSVVKKGNNLFFKF